MVIIISQKKYFLVRIILVAKATELVQPDNRHWRRVIYFLNFFLIVLGKETWVSDIANK